MNSAALPAAPGTTVEMLDPLRLPLHGSRLIEASAGTGKTFTIAALYVRLVLGHGAENAYARPLTPREILVVTFTEAATQELRDRIRVRLAQAAACFRIDAGDDTSEDDSTAADELLLALCQEYPPEQWPACARKLQLAAEAMDEAAVSTIHAWCQRMLREHAFDSDSLFTQTLETDQRELLAEVVRDYWRSFLAALDREAVAECGNGGRVRKPCRMASRISSHMRIGLPSRRCPRRRRCGAASAGGGAAWLNSRRRGRQWVDELQTLLDNAVARKESGWAQTAGALLQAVAADAARPGATTRAGYGPISRRLESPDTCRTGRSLESSASPPDHPALTAIAALAAALQACPTRAIDLLCHAARWVAQRFAAEQVRRAQMGFNDLLTRLDAALHGGQWPRLADSIRQQFPVALIDEFQDTDPVQYRIFDAVYRVAQNAPDTALILIGDPKQAIYAFRGADIHTYLAARRACVSGSTR
jgi:exodeoxyribonuclease V beta subunit